MVPWYLDVLGWYFPALFLFYLKTNDCFSRSSLVSSGFPVQELVWHSIAQPFQTLFWHLKSCKIWLHVSKICFSLPQVFIILVKWLSCVRLFAIPWTVGYQLPPSMEFSRQEYWGELPFLSPGDLPNPGIEPRSPALSFTWFQIWWFSTPSSVYVNLLTYLSIKNPYLINLYYLSFFYYLRPTSV